MFENRCHGNVTKNKENAGRVIEKLSKSIFATFRFIFLNL